MCTLFFSHVGVAQVVTAWICILHTYTQCAALRCTGVMNRPANCLCILIFCFCLLMFSFAFPTQLSSTSTVRCTCTNIKYFTCVHALGKADLHLRIHLHNSLISFFLLQQPVAKCSFIGNRRFGYLSGCLRATSCTNLSSVTSRGKCS